MEIDLLSKEWLESKVQELNDFAVALEEAELELRDNPNWSKVKCAFTLIVNNGLNVAINGFNGIIEQTDSSDTSSAD